MIRIILGVIVGFIAWTIIWLGSDYVLTASLPWYASEQNKFMLAVYSERAAFEASTNMLIIGIARSVVASFLVGYLTAVIAGENRKSPLALGILLVAVGAYFEVTVWRYLPIWYHLVFLLLLIPATIAGGKLKRFSNLRAGSAENIASGEAEVALPAVDE